MLPYNHSSRPALLLWVGVFCGTNETFSWGFANVSFVVMIYSLKFLHSAHFPIIHACIKLLLNPVVNDTLMLNINCMQKWGSDHLALACQLAFVKDVPSGEDWSKLYRVSSLIFHSLFARLCISFFILCLLLSHLTFLGGHNFMLFIK